MRSRKWLPRNIYYKQCFFFFTREKKKILPEKKFNFSAREILKLAENNFQKLHEITKIIPRKKDKIVPEKKKREFPRKKCNIFPVKI